MELRDYQMAALEQVRQAVREGERRIVLQSPTGSGKTAIAAAIVNGASGKKKRVLFTVPAISLIDQTVEAFYAEGIRDVGVIQANHHKTDWSKPIQIASVQTLQVRQVPDADVVLQDECHKLFKFVLKWMLEDHWRKVPFIGLSATPWTRGLGTIYGRLIIGSTTQQLIDSKVLAPFRVFAPSHPDLTGVRTVAGDYHEGELSTAMCKGQLCADIVETWKQKAHGRPTICFAVDRIHASTLADRFTAAGVPAGYMDCNTPMHERADIRRRFLRGDIKIVTNVDVIGIGVDWPEVACISYCRPTKSEMRFCQSIGRGLRMAPGKTDLLILDHSDTHLRLGFVTDINHTALRKGKEPVSAPPTVRLPKECPSCGYLKQYGVLVCPNCGHKSSPPPAVKEYSAAALEEFNGKKRRGRTETFTQEQKAIFYAELKGYALASGKKIGWAAHKFKARFDCWPHWSIKDVAPREAVSAATANWIKSQNMAWAMSKKREEVVQHTAVARQNGSGDNATPAPIPGEPARALALGLCTEQDLEDFV